MMKEIRHLQGAFLLLAFICLFLLGSAYAIEYGFAVNPCPLCLLQRFMLWGLFFIFLGGSFIKTPGLGTSILFIASLFLEMLGALLAARQVWLQHLPKEALPNCTADLMRLLQYEPFMEVLKTVFAGSPECGVVTFTILGLSLASWSLVAFICLIILTLGILILQKKRRI